MKYPNIERGWFNSKFFMLNGDKQHKIDYITNQFNEKFANQMNSNLNQEISEILNFSNYYSAGAMEYGVDGPELDGNNICISIYHYLQYSDKNPRDYDTFSLGNYLTRKSAEYKSCKYQNQSFSINKFDLDLIKSEESNFTRFRK